MAMLIVGVIQVENTVRGLPKYIMCHYDITDVNAICYQSRSNRPLGQSIVLEAVKSQGNQVVTTKCLV